MEDRGNENEPWTPTPVHWLTPVFLLLSVMFYNYLHIYCIYLFTREV